MNVAWGYGGQWNVQENVLWYDFSGQGRKISKTKVDGKLIGDKKICMLILIAAYINLNSENRKFTTTKVKILGLYTVETFRGNFKSPKKLVLLRKWAKTFLYIH